MEVKERPSGVPLIGDKLPEIVVQTTHGWLELPKAYSGKWLVFFSHPADFTPVCTTEFIAFQARIDEFRKLNCELLGLSMDQVFSHIKWVEWIKETLDVEITFPIIADNTGEVARRFGMVHPGKPTNTVRAVFVIDVQGIVRAILYYPEELGRSTDEILRVVEGLQISDENDVVIPANWPNNKLIGDRVIVPPPSDERTAKEHLKQYECYDWWFCHRKLETGR